MAIQSLNREQLRELLRVAAAHSTRDWLLILTTVTHGLRASEAIQIQRNDLDRGFLTVKRLKGSLRTVHPVPGDKEALFNLAGALFDYAKNFHGNQRLFPITRQRFGQLMHIYGELAGLPKHLCHPHALKHTTCMELIDKIGIEHVRQYVGHKSISSTGAYLKVSDEQAAEAVRKARESQDKD